MPYERPEKRDCPDCGVAPGRLHRPSCDVERCGHCGGQALSCDCEPSERRAYQEPWSGVWPGFEEAIEFGLFAKRSPDGLGWVCCDEDDPEAYPDLNRLAGSGEFAWDRERRRFVRN